jgi:hypothetical protein
MGELDGSKEEDEVEAVKRSESCRQGGRARAGRSCEGCRATREGDDGTRGADKAPDGPRLGDEAQVIDIEAQVVRCIEVADQGGVPSEDDDATQVSDRNQGGVDAEVRVSDEGHAPIDDAPKVVDREVRYGVCHQGSNHEEVVDRAQVQHLEVRHDAQAQDHAPAQVAPEQRRELAVRHATPRKSRSRAGLRIQVLDVARGEEDDVLGNVRYAVANALEVVRGEHDPRPALDVVRVGSHQLDHLVVGPVE